MANKNFKVAGLVTAILLSSHIVVGLWTLSLFLLVYFIDLFFFKSINNNCKTALKKILFGSYLWLIPIIISLIFYNNNIIENSSYDIKDFNIYMNVWDHHRNIFSINYNYIAKTLILSTLVIVYVYYFKQRENLIFSLFILINCFGSLLIYLFFKVIPNSLIPQIFINLMFSRVFILHSVIGYPLIISILFFIYKKLNFNINLNFIKYKKLFISIFVILILGLSFNINDFFYKTKNFYINKIEKRLFKFSITLFNKSMNDDDFFWEKIREIPSDGYYVTTFNSSGPTLRYGRKPHILNTSFIDNVAYFPYLATETRLILENIYGISFEEPPIKFLGAIIDTWFKETFEKRSIQEWLEISKKYNISGVIVPSDWNLQIEDKIISEKFIAYILK